MQTVRKEKVYGSFGIYSFNYNVSVGRQYAKRISRRIAKIKERKKFRAIQYLKAVKFLLKSKNKCYFSMYF